MPAADETSRSRPVNDTTNFRSAKTLTQERALQADQDDDWRGVYLWTSCLLQVWMRTGLQLFPTLMGLNSQKQVRTRVVKEQVVQLRENLSKEGGNLGEGRLSDANVSQAAERFLRRYCLCRFSVGFNSDRDHFSDCPMSHMWETHNQLSLSDIGIFEGDDGEYMLKQRRATPVGYWGSVEQWKDRVKARDPSIGNGIFYNLAIPLDDPRYLYGAKTTVYIRWSMEVLLLRCVNLWRRRHNGFTASGIVGGLGLLPWSDPDLKLDEVYKEVLKKNPRTGVEELVRIAQTEVQEPAFGYKFLRYSFNTPSLKNQFIKVWPHLHEDVMVKFFAAVHQRSRVEPSRDNPFSQLKVKYYSSPCFFSLVGLRQGLVAQEIALDPQRNQAAPVDCPVRLSRIIAGFFDLVEVGEDEYLFNPFTNPSGIITFAPQNGFQLPRRVLEKFAQSIVDAKSEQDVDFPTAFSMRANVVDEIEILDPERGNPFFGIRIARTIPIPPPAEAVAEVVPPSRMEVANDDIQRLREKFEEGRRRLKYDKSITPAERGEFTKKLAQHGIAIEEAEAFLDKVVNARALHLIDRSQEMGRVRGLLSEVYINRPPPDISQATANPHPRQMGELPVDYEPIEEEPQPRPKKAAQKRPRTPTPEPPERGDD
jgi:hypothetical protein